MATFSEAICKHRILFPSIQHLAWLPQGRPQGKQKCGKNSDFGLTHWLKHRRPITRKLLKIDGYMMRGFGKHWLLSFHPCNILRDNRRGISRGNKNVGCGTWKRRFLALAVLIAGKLFKVDGSMLRGVWQALNCLFIHATFGVIATEASPGQTKNEGGVRKNDDFSIVVRISGKLL